MRRRLPGKGFWYRKPTAEEIARSAALLREYLERREGKSTTPESKARRAAQLMFAFGADTPNDSTQH
jgi:hypothetical protein